MAKTDALLQAVEEISGTYSLTYTKSTGGKIVRNLISYVPYGKTIKDKVRFHTESGERDSFLVSNVVTRFKPDESEIDRLNVKALIGSPNVRIFGMSDEEHDKLVKKKIKKSNPEYILKSLDRASMTSHVKKMNLVKTRGRLYTEKLSKKRLMWICAAFGISYASKTSDEDRYKAELIGKIDDWLQQSEKNIERFNTTLDQIESVEINFYISELTKLGSISYYNGIYKLNDDPIGSKLLDVIDFLKSNPTVYNEAKNKVHLSNKDTVYA